MPVVWALCPHEYSSLIPSLACPLLLNAQPLGDAEMSTTQILSCGTHSLGVVPSVQRLSPSASFLQQTFNRCLQWSRHCSGHQDAVGNKIDKVPALQSLTFWEVKEGQTINKPDSAGVPLGDSSWWRWCFGWYLKLEEILGSKVEKTLEA